MLTPTLLIGLVIALLVTSAYVKYRDTFHPALIMGPMLAFHYCYSPLRLEATNAFYGYLWTDHVRWAQWVHFTGVAALCLGLFLGSLPVIRLPRSAWDFDDRTLVRGALVMGILGFASFAYGIVFVGGFVEAYGRAYGGGFAESGWVRDIALLPLPALLLLTLSHRSRPITWRAVVLGLLLASPNLTHGLLGARRGPTFIAFAGIALAFYMVRDRRPRLVTLLAGGAALGVLMLSLVANRDKVYWGSDEELDASPAEYFHPGPGNDFIYAAGLIVVADETQDFNWGATYLTTLFVRPIPRALWPTKYEDAAEFFGTPNLEENLGIDITVFQNVLGWTAARGAAPGIVGDMWREFSWAMLPVLLGIGWFYGYIWRRAVFDKGAWVPVYCYAASLSIYLAMQSLQAMLYRFLFGVVPMLLVLRLARRKAREQGTRAFASAS